jgi:hypothetical protein
VGYVANPRPGSGFPPERTLTKLGMLREAGTVDIDRGVMPPSGGLSGHGEGLGFIRRSLALMTRTPEGRFLKPTAGTARARTLSRFGITAARTRSAAAAAAQRAATERARAAAAARARTTTTTTRRRGGIGGMVSRMRARAKAAADRARAAQAEQAANEARQIAEAERLARESVTGTVTDRNGLTVGTALACRGSPPDRRAGWRCFSGRWRYQMPGGGWADQGPQTPPPMNGAPWPAGTPTEPIPSVRPWWLAQPKDGDIPSRDTSGIPPPPGLPGGESMRPPASRSTATEIVPDGAPAAGMDMKKILPLVAGAALLFLNK